MAVRDLTAFFDEGLTYPDVPWRRQETPGDPESLMVEGKTTYKVASPDAKTGLYLSSLARIGVNASVGIPVDAAELAQLQLDDDQERGLYETVLGDTYPQMVADGVSWADVQKIGQDAYLAYALNEDTANAVLQIALAQRLGEAPARTPNRAARRAATRTPQKKAGSKSIRASTGIPARTPARTSTPSSKSSAAAAAR